VNATLARFRPFLIGAYIVGVVLWFGRDGFAPDKDEVMRLVLGALLVWCIGRPLRDMGRLFLEWLPFVAALAVYDTARAGADALGRHVVVTQQIQADKVLFFGNVPTVVLQQHFLHESVHWWDFLATIIYVSHFFAAFIAAGWLWSRNRAAWGVFATRFFLLCFAGAITFALVPTAPPWAAAQMGHLEPVVRSAARGWSLIHLSQPDLLLQNGRNLVNPYAAIPSLHAGWALLVSVTLWPFTSRRWRPLLVAYPIAMGLTLVYTGEHYVIDILIGWLYVWGVIVLERKTRASRLRFVQRFRRRRADTVIDLRDDHIDHVDRDIAPVAVRPRDAKAADGA
jgi:hypothetical protein